MDRQTALVTVIALVSILSVGFAAATLSETVQSGEGGESGVSGGLIDLNPPESERGLPGAATRILIVALALLIAGLLLYLSDNRRHTAEILALVFGVGVVIWFLVQLAAALLGSGNVPLFGSGFPGASQKAGERASTAASVAVILAVLALLVLGIGAVVRQSRGSDAPDADEEEPTDTTPRPEPDDTEAVGRIAGRTADRLEHQDGDSSLDNEVYRAWAEMTEQLDIPDDESTTPREFATAAAEAGLSAEDVEELTELFEAVRYGGYPPTADREQRAVSVLRRIERGYR